MDASSLHNVIVWTVHPCTMLQQRLSILAHCHSMEGPSLHNVIVWTVHPPTMLQYGRFILAQCYSMDGSSSHIVIVTTQHQRCRQCASFTHVYVFVLLTVPHLHCNLCKYESEHEGRLKRHDIPVTNVMTKIIQKEVLRNITMMFNTLVIHVIMKVNMEEN